MSGISVPRFDTKAPVSLSLPSSLTRDSFYDVFLLQAIAKPRNVLLAGMHVYWWDEGVL